MSTQILYLKAISTGIDNIKNNVLEGEIPIAIKPAYVSDPKNPAPPVPEDHALIIDLLNIHN